MDDNDSVQFRRQLLLVADGLGREDVQGLKFLCKDLIPFGKLEAMTSACEVFQFLISNDTVNTEDTFFIAELLFRIHHNYLLDRIGYTKEKVQENLHLKGRVSEFRQMLYKLSQELTDDDLRAAEFLLRKHLPKKQIYKHAQKWLLYQKGKGHSGSTTTVRESKRASALNTWTLLLEAFTRHLSISTENKSGVELLTALERKDLLSENNLQLLEKLCSEVAPGFLMKINEYKLKRVCVSVQESKEIAPSSVRKSSFEGAGLPAAIQEQEASIKCPTQSLGSYISLREHSGHIHSLGSNPGVKAENVVGSSEQSVPLWGKDDESKAAAEEPCTYKMDGPCRGQCLIFNNVNFEEHLTRRTGSQKDAEELRRVFKWLGLEVVTYMDQTSTEIHQCLQKWQLSENWKDSDCLVCCILSHGQSGEIYSKDAQLIPIRTIMSYFTARQCPLLTRKPKLFFIQACQGEKIQKAVYFDADADDCGHLGADAQSTGSASSQPSIPEEADFLLGMATVDGYLSFRHIREGAWYIQALCAKLRELVPKGEDILSILTEVNKDVSYRADPGGFKKQMPQPAFTLRKKLVFPIPKDPPPPQQP